MPSLSELLNLPAFAIIRLPVKLVCRKWKIGNYQFRYNIGAVHRPNYAYLLYQAAWLAKRLGIPRVSVVEFGVAGGNGLANMEQHAEIIEKMFGVAIEIYGFDAASGLPASTDYRDLPYHWQPGSFKMDVGALRARLKRSKLILGDIRETLDSFIGKYNPAPIGAISYDLDYYTSTVAALKLLEADPKFLLPRIPVYFDDVIGRSGECHSDYTGERLAIHEFNAAHERRKLSPQYDLVALQPAQMWHHQIWSLHAFDHPLYNQFVGSGQGQLPLIA